MTNFREPCFAELWSINKENQNNRSKSVQQRHNTFDVLLRRTYVEQSMPGNIL